MIKARAVVKGRDTIILGLTKENIDRLLKNQPIMFPAVQLGLTEFDQIVIIGGETMDDIREDLRSIGLSV